MWCTEERVELLKHRAESLVRVWLASFEERLIRAPGGFAMGSMMILISRSSDLISSLQMGQPTRRDLPQTLASNMRPANAELRSGL